MEEKGRKKVRRKRERERGERVKAREKGMKRDKDETKQRSKRGKEGTTPKEVEPMVLPDVNCKCSGEPNNRIISQTVLSPFAISNICLPSPDIDLWINDNLLSG